jgi:hypothetical protein
MILAEQVQEKRLSQFKLDYLWRLTFPVDDGDDLDTDNKPV